MLCMGAKNCVFPPVEGSGLCRQHLREHQELERSTQAQARPLEPEPPPLRAKNFKALPPSAPSQEARVDTDSCFCGRPKGHRGIHQGQKRGPVVGAAQPGKLSRDATGHKTVDAILEKLKAQRTELIEQIKACEIVIQLSAELFGPRRKT